MSNSSLGRLNCGRFFQALIVVGVLLMALTTNAQPIKQPTWKYIKKFPSAIGCGYFWDPDHGLVGSGVRTIGSRGRISRGDQINIYKTTDGGASWITAITPTTPTIPPAPPNPQRRGAVTKIEMFDTLNGVASIFSDDFFYRPGLWHTTDGGLSWFERQPAIPDPGFATSVHVTSKATIVTAWNDATYGPGSNFGMSVSTDQGISWSQPFAGRGNFTAFTDDTTGVASVQSNNEYLRTTDGGVTWTSTVFQNEAWTIYPLLGTRTFITANEAQGPPGTGINVSTDAGLSWQRRVTFPYMPMTGGIGGWKGTLYFQTDEDYSDSLMYFRYGVLSGMYRSDDTGHSWRWIGGPKNIRDTRFVVTGCSGEVVYAFDDSGGVHKTIDGGNGELADGNMLQADYRLDEDTIHISSTTCLDSARIVIRSTDCVPVFLDSVVRLTGKDVYVNGLLGSKQLALGDSMVYWLRFTPADTGSQIASFQVFGHAGSFWKRKIVHVVADNHLPFGLFLSSDTLKLSTVNCETKLDSILLGSLGCRRVLYDSIRTVDGDLKLLTQFPVVTDGANFGMLRLAYSTDSTRSATHKLRLFAHNDTRSFDTTITVITTTVNDSARLNLGTDSIAFDTKYCLSKTEWLRFGNDNCRTLIIDSIRSSSTSFHLSGLAKNVISRGGLDSVNVHFDPDSSGWHEGSVKVYAHTSSGRCDTVIYLKGLNFARHDRFTLTNDSIHILTTACTPFDSTFGIVNECCEAVIIDSIVGVDGEFKLEYDSQNPSRVSGDTLRVRVLFTPDSGGWRSQYVRVFAHTSTRKFDTTILVVASNAISAHPLQLSTDRLDFVTKYCQPIELPFDLSNLSCSPLHVDSAVLSEDALEEYRISKQPGSALGSNTSAGFGVEFHPVTRGSRGAKVHLYAHSLEAKMDTIITIDGKNITSPEPYIPPLVVSRAGDTISIPIMLLPTTDPFGFSSFTAHVSMNTDLLTPFRAETRFTFSDSGTVTFDTANASGANFHVELKHPIDHTSDLSKPLVYIRAKVTLTNTRQSDVHLESFAVDQAGALPLCDPPVQGFTSNDACADPQIVEFMAGGKITTAILGVSPNPTTNARGWTLKYKLGEATDAELDVVDAQGHILTRNAAPETQAGEHTTHIDTALPSGTYFIVMRTARKTDVRKVTVRN